MIGYFTVPHTGTQYWRKHHFGQDGLDWVNLGREGKVQFAHCLPRNENALLAFPGPIVTTYRDPLHVAVSWYARGKLDNYDLWRKAWDIWARIAPRATVLHSDSATEKENSRRFNSLVHHYLDNNDPELYKLIDRDEVGRIVHLCQSLTLN